MEEAKSSVLEACLEHALDADFLVDVCEFIYLEEFKTRKKDILHWRLQQTYPVTLDLLPSQQADDALYSVGFEESLCPENGCDWKEGLN
jgi:hypothetical protein